MVNVVLWIALFMMGMSQGNPCNTSVSADFSPTSRLVNEGIGVVQEALYRGTLTKELVEENICKASLHDRSALISFAQNIKVKTFLLANQVLKKGKDAFLSEIENALAALGILQWAGVEGIEVRGIQIRLLALLKVKKNCVKDSYEPSV